MPSPANSHEIIENSWIPLADGTRLAAKIWLPADARATPVPAIFEYIPYRKRDGTTPRGMTNYPVFAAAGYAGVRVDIKGSGESDSLFDDEYSPRELAEACEVFDWIAAQPWCTGAIGMMGISWGGFNALQVAALRPKPLKAVISLASTVDRYNDDIHFKNSCLLQDSGAHEIPDTGGLVAREVREERYEINPAQPLSSVSTTHWVVERSRGAWSICTITRQRMTMDRTHFHIEASLEAFEGADKVADRSWREKIARDHM